MEDKGVFPWFSIGTQTTQAVATISALKMVTGYIFASGHCNVRAAVKEWGAERPRTPAWEVHLPKWCWWGILESLQERRARNLTNNKNNCVQICVEGWR